MRNDFFKWTTVPLTISSLHAIFIPWDWINPAPEAERTFLEQFFCLERGGTPC